MPHHDSRSAAFLNGKAAYGASASGYTYRESALAGLMWVPFSWIIQHWVGLFHTVVRTVLVTAAWYLAPHRRFVAIPAVIVGVYAVTIVILERRWHRLNANVACALSG